ncbi:Zn-dependent exopeptidase [Apiospora saccharicola]
MPARTARTTPHSAQEARERRAPTGAADAGRGDPRARHLEHRPLGMVLLLHARPAPGGQEPDHGAVDGGPLDRERHPLGPRVVQRLPQLPGEPVAAPAEPELRPEGQRADHTHVPGRPDDPWLPVQGGRAPDRPVRRDAPDPVPPHLVRRRHPAPGRRRAVEAEAQRRAVLVGRRGVRHGGLDRVGRGVPPWLNATAVSYLNIDIGASGPHPGLAATPELHDVAVETMKKVMWMETNRTMFDVWNEESQGYIDVLGSGSDYTAFVASGIGAVDVGSGNGGSDPVYHYHSNFDSYHWMTTYGDPGFVSHKSMAQYLTLLAYKLADADLIPFNISTYGTEMNDYFADLEKTVNSTSLALDLSPLRDAIDDFAAQASALGALQQQLLLSSDSDPQSSSPFDDDAATAALLASVNQKSRDFQRGFVSQGGLPGREFYKHVVFAPGVDTGYAAATFPGITEALVQARNGTLAAEWVRKTAAAIKVAADIVKP